MKKVEKKEPAEENKKVKKKVAEKKEEKVVPKKAEKKSIKEENVMEDKKEKKSKKEVEVEMAKEIKPEVEVTKTEKKKEESKIEMDEISKQKVETILRKAKENGKITYGELANELEDTNPDQIDKVFDVFEDLGVSVLQDDDLDVEPDLEDLQDVEDIKLEEIDLTNIEGVNIDDPVRMYLREIGKIPLLTYDQELELATEILAGSEEAKQRLKIGRASCRERV